MPVTYAQGYARSVTVRSVLTTADGRDIWQLTAVNAGSASSTVTVHVGGGPGALTAEATVYVPAASQFAEATCEMRIVSPS